MADLATGSVFAGHRIDGTLGKGGMGVVYRATDLRLDRAVALKVVAAEYAQDAAFAARFKRESRLAASLDHPNVIPIYHAGEEDGLLYVTMRYVEGTDLAQVLKRDKRLAPERAVAITAQIAAALDAAHARGLVHRDVKPANVLLQDEHVFLTDFGLSKHMSSETGLTESGMFMGTVDYMAPEQAQGRETDARSDVYALGCVLFQMLSGRVPFEKPNVMAKLWAQVNELAPPLEGDLGAVVVRAMEKDPGRRFQSAGDLARAAAGAIGMPLPSTSASTTIPARRAQRRPIPRWAIAAALVAIAAIAGIIAVASGGGSTGAGEKPAVIAVLKRLHRGFTLRNCREDLTENFRATYFSPRTGREALNACFNSAGGPPNQAPFVLHALRIQGDAASAKVDVESEPVTFYLLKRGGRWLANSFTETAKGRYERQVTSAIQPSFRNTAALEAFTFGQLSVAKAGDVPSRAVEFLAGASKQLAALRPPPGFGDIHQRLQSAIDGMAAASRSALAAQKADDAGAFRRADKQVFAELRKLGAALGDLSRAQ